MKKACLLSLSLLAMSLGAHAVPAKRMVYTMKQSDGTTIQVYKHGESYCAYYTTLDGKVLYSNPDINYDLSMPRSLMVSLSRPASWPTI